MQVHGTTDNSSPTANVPALLLNSDGSLKSATGTSAYQVQGPAADGAAAVGNPNVAAGVDGSGNVQALSTDTAGNQYNRAALQTTSAMTQAAISFSSSGDNTIVAAGAGAVTTRVFRMFFVVTAATVITIKNGAGASLTGAMPLSAGGSMFFDFNAEPWFKTSAATAFIINSSVATQVSGMVDYVKD
jgi:hypothetical protein